MLVGPVMGSVWGVRTMKPVGPTSRRRCFCGCGKRATHLGLGDGVGLVTACELYIRRWVRDGVKTSRLAVCRTKLSTT